MPAPAVLFLVFNRPDPTRRVFEEIRRARPSRLYVAADGPRHNRKGEAELCRQTREVVNGIDWECQVFTLFREQNLGCRRAVSSSIDWFFAREEEGIILEDDCLPNESFFRFCGELLEKHRHEPRVMHISGSNFQYGQQRGAASYFYSRIPHIWGWATWRRAWQQYDVDIKTFPEFVRNKQITRIFAEKESQQYWNFHFRRMYRGSDTWDYQWAYAIFKADGLCITPNVNLISNIGFGAAATHATETNSPVANLPTHEITRITHPAQLAADQAADYYTMHKAFPKPGIMTMARYRLEKIVRKGMNLYR
jgi:hypothetical protein